jgi:competence ComEA-like helix-hairpin-helix protein
MTRQEKQLILFLLVVVSAGLLFLSLNRFRFYQNYIQNIYETTLTNKVFSTDTEEKDDINRIIVDINSASVSALMQLPGIGRETALRIIEYRSEFGKFSDISDLLKVHGIGIKKLEHLKEYVVIIK